MDGANDLDGSELGAPDEEGFTDRDGADDGTMTMLDGIPDGAVDGANDICLDGMLNTVGASDGEMDTDG